MIVPSESTINSRARLAEALARVIDADPRVRRWRRVEFADDGSALVVVELYAEPGGIVNPAYMRRVELAVAGGPKR